MMKSKKGDGTFWIIGEIAIVVVILVIVFLILNKNFGWFNIGINSCEAKGGQCLSSCGAYDPIPAGDGQCKTEHKDTSMVCCKKPEAEPGKEGEDARGEGANVNLINVLLDNQKTSLAWGESRELEIRDTPYKFEAVLDYKKIQALGKFDENPVDHKEPRCSFFLKDTNTKEEYVLKRSATAIDSSQLTTGDYSWMSSKYTFNADDSFVVGCSISDTIQLRYWKPTDSQAGHTYQLRIIVYDKEVSAKSPQKGASLDFSSPSDESALEIRNLLFDESNWLVEFTAYFKVKPIVEIRDIGGTWASSDDITVNVVNPNYKLSSVEVAIVPGDGVNPIKGDASISLGQALKNSCDDASTKYYSMLRRIKSTKVGTPGFNLGLFALGRDVYQSALYEASDPEPIKIENDVKATVHIDASTISKTFAISSMSVEKPVVNENDVKEQYLCVRAHVASSDGKTVKVITTVNQQPLRLDVAPPLIDNTDSYITVEYPNPESFQQTVTQLIAENRISPTQRLTPYYFNRYPRVVFKKCIDRSGCKEYDYYFAPTNINININTGGDLGAGITAIVLSYAVNQLYQALVTSKPLETLCPLPNDIQYRHNTAAEIRFSRLQQGQGIYCLKIVDAAGNYWMTWKAVYNPYDVFDEITGELLGTGVTH
jgi:hypothetical protein